MRQSEKPVHFEITDVPLNILTNYNWNSLTTKGYNVFLVKSKNIFQNLSDDPETKNVDISVCYVFSQGVGKTKSHQENIKFIVI